MKVEDKYLAQERQGNCEHKTIKHFVNGGTAYYSNCNKCGEPWPFKKQDKLENSLAKKWKEHREDLSKSYDKPERIEEIIECDPHDLSYHSLTHQTQVVRKINEIINKLNNL